MSLTKTLVVFLAAVASVNGLATGHVARHNTHHHAIAARAAESHVEPLVLRQTPARTERQRCKPRVTFVSASASPSPTPDQVIPPVNVAPIPSPSPSPSPSPAPAPEPVTSAAPSPAPAPAQPVDDSAPSFMRGTQTGEGTYYDTGLGACGETNNDGDYIAAVSHELFDNFPGYGRVNPNLNPMCGRSVTVSYQGRSITVRLVDRCTACKLTDLDFSPAAFKDLAPNGDGRIHGMTWTWN
ncbi:riboflavin aldehyde-forming enzyme [Coprinopsis sp. MPI-PUGE-AT-0042]|nr:riboflavin aldehyde-forming enzyme [Coprinopsis sp. MPI-PUGE-AT-0042]